jgi:hypothetical protein
LHCRNPILVPGSPPPYFCIPHPKYRERTGGRKGHGTCTVRLSILVFLLFLLLGFFLGIGREEGREGKCAILYRNDVRTLPSRRPVHGAEGGLNPSHPRDGHLGLAFTTSQALKKERNGLLSISLFWNCGTGDGQKCVFFTCSSRSKEMICLLWE